VSVVPNTIVLYC